MIPWEHSLLSVEPSSRSLTTVDVKWGFTDTVSAKCEGSEVYVLWEGGMTHSQRANSAANIWPYGECTRQTMEKGFVPFTEACYEASNELSTLRSYYGRIVYKNVSSNNEFK